MSNPQLVGLWAYDPKEAAKWVREAIEKEKSLSADGYHSRLVDRTAARLKISRRTLFNWIKNKPELEGVI